MPSRTRIVTVIAALSLGLGVGWSVAAQDTKPAKNWKDRAEYDVANAAGTAKPEERIALLDKWKQQYPQTEFSDEREDAYLTTYQQTNQQRQAFNKAQEILKTRPNNFRALSAILQAVSTFKPPQPADLDAAEKTAIYLLDNLDTVFSASNKPADVKEDDWGKVKTDMKPYAITTLVGIYQARKDNPRAETDLTKLLQRDPTQASVSYALAGAVLAQNKEHPEKQPAALFDFARAAAYDGPNSLPATARKQVGDYLARAYKSYHGSDEGLDKLLVQAKTNAMPPADWAGIKDIGKIHEEEAVAAAAEAAKNPMLTLWRTAIREPLTAADGADYYEKNMKEALLPGGANNVMRFKGKLVSQTPATRPKELVVAIEKPDVPDATLKFEIALPGKMEPGEDIEFEGVPQSFTKEPFMVVFEVEREKTNWSGKNTPAAPKGKAAPKGAAKKQ